MEEVEADLVQKLAGSDDRAVLKELGWPFPRCDGGVVTGGGLGGPPTLGEGGSQALLVKSFIRLGGGGSVPIRGILGALPCLP